MKSPATGFLRTILPPGDQIGDDLRVVPNLELPAEMGVVLLQRVVAVGTGGDDLLHVVALHHLDVRLGQRLVEVFVAAPHRGIAAAPSSVPKMPKLTPAAFRILAKAVETFFPRSSNDPAQPT